MSVQTLSSLSCTGTRGHYFNWKLSSANFTRLFIILSQPNWLAIHMHCRVAVGSNQRHSSHEIRTLYYTFQRRVAITVYWYHNNALHSVSNTSFWISCNCWSTYIYKIIPYFSIDNAHVMYNAHPKIFRHSFWCIDNAHGVFFDR